MKACKLSHNSKTHKIRDAEPSTGGVSLTCIVPCIGLLGIVSPAIYSYPGAVLNIQYIIARS